MYDEVYHAYTASRYVALDPDAFVWWTRPPVPAVGYTWNHPPAGLWCLAGGIALLGDGPWGWRAPSAVFGAAGVALAYLLAMRVTRRRAVARLAGGLLALEGLWFVQSRTGMLDTFTAVFLLAAFLAFHAALTSAKGEETGPLLATGLCLGLAIATKWSAAYPAAILAAWAIVRSRARSWPILVVPPMVYLAAYAGFFAVGHGLPDWIELQRQILLYHARLEATHDYASRWWQWPLALRPVWYHVARGDGWVANVYAHANPFLTWAFLPAFAVAAARWMRRDRVALGLLAAGFLGSWLPWMLVPRIAFAYHFLPAVPFGALAVASVVIAGHDAGGSRRWAGWALVAAIAAAFVFFYPIYAAVPLSPDAFEARMWLSGWR